MMGKIGLQDWFVRFRKIAGSRHHTKEIRPCQDCKTYSFALAVRLTGVEFQGLMIYCNDAILAEILLWKT